MSESTQPITRPRDPASRQRADSPAKPSIVRIVGIGDGIVMRIGDQEGRWGDIVRVLAGHLVKAEGFFQGERVAIEIGSRLLSADDMQQIADVLTGYNIAIWAVRTSNPETRRMAQEIGLSVEGADGNSGDGSSGDGSSGDGSSGSGGPGRIKDERARWEVHLGQRGQVAPSVKPQSEFQPPQSIADSIADRAIDPNSQATELGTLPPSQKKAVAPSPLAVFRTDADADADADEDEEDTDDQSSAEVILAPPYIYRGTLRSGQVFRHAGTIMLIGDVNPGAEVISGGDIFVWGRLRGIVHAGAMGNERSVVCAIDFEPIQLRIAGYIAMSPKAVTNEPGRWFWRRNAVEKPEVARVMGKQIVVDVWDSQWK